MTSDASTPVTEPEYVSDEVVSRENNEVYTLDVWTISGQATPESSAYTFERTEGLYKVSPEDCPKAVNALDEALEILTSKYGAVDEHEFERIEGDAYEVMVSIEDATEVSAYDAKFNHNRALVHVMGENDAEVVEMVDDALDALREEISNN